jgi:hypothetical protein
VNAHYEFMYGEPSTGYLELGTALHKAILAGLHLGVAGHSVSIDQLDEDTGIFWMLKYFER